VATVRSQNRTIKQIGKSIQHSIPVFNAARKMAFGPYFGLFCGQGCLLAWPCGSESG
jgi:hypothetical protein